MMAMMTTNRDSYGRLFLWVGFGSTVLLSGALAGRADLAWVVMAVGLGAVVGILEGSYPLLLGLTTATVIMGSGTYDALAATLFYPRFMMYGALITANLLLMRRLDLDLREKEAYLLAACFVALAVMSAVWSSHPGLTISRAISMGLLLSAVATSALARWGNRAELVSDLRTIAVVDVIVLFLSLLALVAGIGLTYRGERFNGILQNPNTIGVIAAFSIPLIITTWRESRRTRYWIGVALGVIGFALLLSQSRGGLGGAVAALVVIARFGRSVRGRRAVVALLVAGTLLLGLAITVPNLMPNRLVEVASRIQGTDEAAGGGGRYKAWALAVDVWLKKPLLGWGFGTTEHSFGSRVVEIEQTFQGTHPHNAFLELLLELGPLGPTLMLLLTILIASALARARLDPVGVGIAGALSAGGVLMFVESGLTSAGSIFGWHFWFLAAGGLRLASLAGATGHLANRRVS